MIFFFFNLTFTEIFFCCHTLYRLAAFFKINLFKKWLGTEEFADEKL